MLKEFILEPSSVPQNLSIPSDSIPNILLRSKLAPEVIGPIINQPKESVVEDSKLKMYSNAIRTLQEKFSIIQDDLQRAAGEKTSLMLANEITTTSAPSRIGSEEEDFEAILENSVRWLYTGIQ